MRGPQKITPNLRQNKLLDYPMKTASPFPLDPSKPEMAARWNLIRRKISLFFSSCRSRDIKSESNLRSSVWRRKRLPSSKPSLFNSRTCSCLGFCPRGCWVSSAKIDGFEWKQTTQYANYQSMPERQRKEGSQREAQGRQQTWRPKCPAVNTVCFMRLGGRGGERPVSRLWR